MCAQCNIWHAYQSSSSFHLKEPTVHVECCFSRIIPVNHAPGFYPFFFLDKSGFYLLYTTYTSFCWHAWLFSPEDLAGLVSIPTRAGCYSARKSLPGERHICFILLFFVFGSVVQFICFGFDIKTTMRYKNREKVTFERSGKRVQWDSSIG
jgi:hypothetical protein